MAEPDKIRIPYDADEGGRFDYIGKLPDGTQFMAFITGGFVSDYLKWPYFMWQYNKKWLAVVHRFDADGLHIGSESRLGGRESEGRLVVEEKALVHFEAMLAELASAGPLNWTDIWVRPFSVEIDDILHGLIYGQVEWDSDYIPEEGEVPDDYVKLEPQDIMFHPPWDSGEYSS